MPSTTNLMHSENRTVKRDLGMESGHTLIQTTLGGSKEVFAA
jgi:hypothetical protein